MDHLLGDEPPEEPQEGGPSAEETNPNSSPSSGIYSGALARLPVRTSASSSKRSSGHSEDKTPIIMETLEFFMNMMALCTVTFVFSRQKTPSLKKWTKEPAPPGQQVLALMGGKYVISSLQDFVAKTVESHHPVQMGFVERPGKERKVVFDVDIKTLKPLSAGEITEMLLIIYNTISKIFSGLLEKQIHNINTVANALSSSSSTGEDFLLNLPWSGWMVTMACFKRVEQFYKQGFHVHFAFVVTREHLRLITEMTLEALGSHSREDIDWKEAVDFCLVGGNGLRLPGQIKASRCNTDGCTPSGSCMHCYNNKVVSPFVYVPYSVGGILEVDSKSGIAPSSPVAVTRDFSNASLSSASHSNASLFSRSERLFKQLVNRKDLFRWVSIYTDGPVDGPVDPSILPPAESLVRKQLRSSHQFLMKDFKHYGKQTKAVADFLLSQNPSWVFTNVDVRPLAQSGKDSRAFLIIVKGPGATHCLNKRDGPHHSNRVYFYMIIRTRPEKRTRGSSGSGCGNLALGSAILSGPGPGPGPGPGQPKSDGGHIATMTEHIDITGLQIFQSCYKCKGFKKELKASQSSMVSALTAAFTELLPTDESEARDRDFLRLMEEGESVQTVQVEDPWVPDGLEDSNHKPAKRVKRTESPEINVN